MVQRHIEEKDLLNASQFCFPARHRTTLQCMRLTNHVTLNFNNNICSAAVFLDIKTAFDKTLYPRLLHKLYRLNFSPSLIKLIHSFQSERKFVVSVEGDTYTPKAMQVWMPQDPVLSTTLYGQYINDTPKTLGVHLAPLEMTEANFRIFIRVYSRLKVSV
jgi:hypothetical protein